MDGNVVALALTAAGALPAAYAIQFIIQIIKMVPQFAGFVTGREKLMSFILAFVTVIAAFYIGLTSVPPSQDLSLLGIIGAVLAGFSIARLAMAAYDDVIAKDGNDHPTESVLNPKGWTGN